MVRKKNLLSTMAQSFAIACLVTVLWVVIGYSLAFTEDSPWIGGTTRFALEGSSTRRAGRFRSVTSRRPFPNPFS